MSANWTTRLHFIRRHLTMLLAAFCVLILQSQLAIAAHHCDLNLSGESAMQQHLNHQTMPSTVMKTPLCEKHCVPDSAPKTLDYPPMVALPVSMTIAVTERPCAAVETTDWTLKPPAVGPPATIRFCRFRE